MKVDILSAAKMWPNDSSFWQYKVYADIRVGSLDRGHQTTVGCRQWQFSVLSLVISLESLEIRPESLHSYTESLVDFPMILNHVTLNDLEWIFHVKFCFAPVALELFRMAIENNCVKTNTSSVRQKSIP